RIGRFRVVPATPEAVEAAILAARRIRLVDRAESCVPAAESCRGWSETRLLRGGIVLALAALAAVLAAPLAVLATLSLIAVALLVAGTGLRLVAVLAALQAPLPPAAQDRPLRQPPPP